MFQLLTAPNALAQPTQAIRYIVQLASIETQLNSEGVLVPHDVKIVDVVVAEGTEAAIKALLAAADWLQGYELVSYWQPEDCCDCF